MVYCPSCGPFMSAGFCLHGSVADTLAREKRKGGKKGKGY